VERLIRVGNCEDIPHGEGRKYSLNGEDVGVFNVGDKILAISNVCPHLGGPLSDGLIVGEEVICPLHSRKINLRTGCVKNENESVRTYEVILKNGEIYLKI